MIRKSNSPSQPERNCSRSFDACHEIYNLACDSYINDDIVKARSIEPLQSVISNMCEAFREDHIDRLASGKCTAEQGFIFK
jgi:phosphate:Na+ symporter